MDDLEAIELAAASYRRLPKSQVATSLTESDCLGVLGATLPVLLTRFHTKHLSLPFLSTVLAKPDRIEQHINSIFFLLLLESTFFS